MKRVLLVDDDASVREALTFSLEESGYVVDAAASAKALQSLEERAPHVVLTDMRMPGMSGLELVEALKVRVPHVPVVVITAYGSIDTAVEALRAGAADFITKPVARGVLQHALERVLHRRGLEEENAALRAQLDAQSVEPDIVAVSESMKASLRLTDRVADTDATILITGESGTGKELIAQRLHQRSRRAAGPFVAINCSALPPDLLEAELFGFEKGAFTGATRPRRGRFVEASGGTLFLDEIAEMPLLLQAKLLRVLQERVVDVVGGDAVKVDVRIVAATHRDLRAMADAGTFREDLFFRLHVVPIALAPLRERPDDIAPLFLRFLRAAARAADAAPKTASPELLDALAHRTWPGNVREVENLATRLRLTSPRAHLDVVDLSTGDGMPHPPRAAAEAAPGAHVDEHGVLRLPASGVSLEALERAAVVAALRARSGNQTQAARFLRIPRHVLLYRIEKYGIVAEDYRGAPAVAAAPLHPVAPDAQDES